ncbi:MAG: T9SS type A sorting domain-containing protein, partial [Bacteroidota bacterium]
IFSNSYQLSPTLQYCDGAFFSPGGNRLYLTAYQNINTASSYRILQYDLTAGSPTDIQNSAVEVGQSSTKINRFQQGPDGRIYVTNDAFTYMSTIEAPNQLGTACKYDDLSFPMYYFARSRQRVPNLVPVFGMRDELPLHGPDSVCANAQDVMYALSCSDSTVWAYSGGGSVDSISPTRLTIDFGGVGVDTLVVWSRFRCGPDMADTLLIQVGNAQAFSLGADTTLCPGDILTLSPGPGFSVDAWHDASDSSAFVVDSTALIWVDVYDGFGCLSRDSVQVTQFNAPAPQVNFGADTTICDNQPLVLQAGPGTWQFVWQDASTDSSFTVSTAGLYHVQASDQCQRTASDSIQVALHPQPAVQLGNDTTICPGDTLFLQAGPAGFNYLWQDNSTANSFSATQGGLYTVQSSNQCSQTATDSLLLSIVAPPAIQLPPDSTICSNAQLTLSAPAGFSSYLWQNNATGNSITAQAPGTYWVEVADHCGQIARDSFELSHLPLPTVDLGPDTVLCLGAFLPLQTAGSFAAYLWQNGSQSAINVASMPGWYWLQVTDGCGLTAVDSLEIIADAPQGVTVTGDTVICAGDTVTLAATGGFTTYQWQDGSTGANYPVTGPGMFIVTATNAFGCSYTDSLSVSACVGIESAVAPEVSVYPNPATTAVNMEVSGLAPGTALRVELWNALGQIVETRDLVHTGHVTAMEMGLSDLARGPYWLRLSWNAGQVVRRIELR